jgi:hypothetical protein
LTNFIPKPRFNIYKKIEGEKKLALYQKWVDLLNVNEHFEGKHNNKKAFLDPHCLKVRQVRDDNAVRIYLLIWSAGIRS